VLQHGHAGGAHTAPMMSFGRLILAQSGRSGFETGGVQVYSLVPRNAETRRQGAHRARSTTVEGARCVAATVGRLRLSGILATLSPPSYPHTR
jgi:hypothetical protein